MATPDFTKYNVEELLEALDSIDRQKYPERVKHIEALLDQPKMRENKQAFTDSKTKLDSTLRITGLLSYSWFNSLLVFFKGRILLLGSRGVQAKVILLHSKSGRVAAAIIFFLLGVYFFKKLFPKPKEKGPPVVKTKTLGKPKRPVNNTNRKSKRRRRTVR